MTFNYDRVEKPKQFNMVEMIQYILKTKQNFGRVFIKFGIPTTSSKNSSSIIKYVLDQY